MLGAQPNAGARRVCAPRRRLKGGGRRGGRGRATPSRRPAHILCPPPQTETGRERGGERGGGDGERERSERRGERSESPPLPQMSARPTCCCTLFWPCGRGGGAAGASHTLERVSSQGTLSPVVPPLSPSLSPRSLVSSRRVGWCWPGGLKSLSPLSLGLSLALPRRSASLRPAKLWCAWWAVKIAGRRTHGAPARGAGGSCVRPPALLPLCPCATCPFLLPIHR